MITNTRDRIVEYVTKNRQARVHDLVDFLGLSHVAVHKQLKALIADGVLRKVGKPPLVFYTLVSKPESIHAQPLLPKGVQNVIDLNFLSITPEGKLLYGLSGFIYWANLYQKNQPFLHLAQKYVKVLEQKTEHTASEGWIDATEKLKNTFKESYIDHLLYQDIYSYPLFGRTKLAKLVMHAKQAENKKIIDQIVTLAKPLIEKVIRKFDIKAVGFIPPTVPRPLQFMDELETKLSLALPKIDLVKIMAGDILVPQKTLAKLEERIINARSSIYLRHIAESSYPNVLLVDDVAGSGASFNETAGKLKALKIGYNRIVAFALVGNIKGYDVIRQM
jgi:hypothetical protein